MKIAACLVCWLVTVSAWAAPKSNALVTCVSDSRQFIVHGVPTPLPRDSEQFLVRGVPITTLPSGTTAPRGLIRLDPTLLAVSSERIKGRLLQELSLPDQWRGTIGLVIQFTLATNAPLVIDSSWFPSGWKYRIVIPDEMDTTKLTRTLVQVLLLEMANRYSGPQPAEVPLWLSEGFAQHLMASGACELLLRNYTGTVRRELRMDPLLQARLRLADQTPLTFNQLSLPSPGQLSGPAWQNYQLCSQLLVEELLRLKGGRAAMQELFRQLPQHLNWQTAFLIAFRDNFQRLLDVEKWWSLTLANAGRRDQLYGWSPAESLARLDEILRLPAQVRTATNDLPSLSVISLQKLIELWDYPIQKDVLMAKLHQLQGFRVNAIPGLLPLVDAYLNTLAVYLQKRGEAGYEPEVKNQVLLRPRLLAKDAIRQLDRLDAARENLRYQQTASQ
jgi:hypothetical protein